jgi:hypothetical protein
MKLGNITTIDKGWLPLVLTALGVGAYGGVSAEDVSALEAAINAVAVVAAPLIGQAFLAWLTTNKEREWSDKESAKPAKKR